MKNIILTLHHVGILILSYIIMLMERWNKIGQFCRLSVNKRPATFSNTSIEESGN